MENNCQLNFQELNSNYLGVKNIIDQFNVS